jgi:hypothetical protein
MPSLEAAQPLDRADRTLERDEDKGDIGFPAQSSSCRLRKIIFDSAPSFGSITMTLVRIDPRSS